MVNPDDIALEFGYHVGKDDFVAGLKYLLENIRWEEQGEKGYNYIKTSFEFGR